MPQLPAWIGNTFLPHSTRVKRTASEMYGSIVASARQKTFYASWGIPDSREGRLEMLLLHVTLVMLRLEQAGSDGAVLSRALAETFIIDLDDNMREIGIGDLAVPRKIKKAGAALFDRHRDYGRALVANDTADFRNALQAALTFDPALSTLEGPVDVRSICAYSERMWGALQVATDPECLAGRLPLPFPADASPSS